MATIVRGNERIEVPDDDPRIMAYAALEHAASQTARRNANTQTAAHLKARRSRKTFQFFVTDAHRSVIDAMPKVLSGEITPEDAMGLLWTYDVATQRGVKP